MDQSLPLLFILLAAGCLVAALCALWLSLRNLLGDPEQTLLTQSAASQRHGELLDEKDAVLRSIKDLEFEHEVGKLSDADFERLNAQFRRRAKQILRELDRDLGTHRERAQKLIEGARKRAGKASS